jgi:hypothetical protein
MRAHNRGIVLWPQVRLCIVEYAPSLMYNISYLYENTILFL